MSYHEKWTTVYKCSLFACCVLFIATSMSAAPRVVKVEPEVGDMNVDPNITAIRITFSEDMTTSRMMSICGGGEKFPNSTGGATWERNRTLVWPVKLEKNHEYAISINCPASNKNFKSNHGVPAEFYPIHFQTGDGEGNRTVEKKLTARDNLKSIVQLRKAVDEQYSYRDLRTVDWDLVFATHKDALVAANTPNRFAAEAGRMLANAKDKHIWLKVGERGFGSYSNPVEPNANFQMMTLLIPEFQKRSAVVFTGRFVNGIYYLRVNSWDNGHTKALEQMFVALWEAADAPGLVIDVRGNDGGSEGLAEQLAGCFVDESKLYAKHVYRNINMAGGFGSVNERMMEPNRMRPKYRGKIAVLTGPVVMSSNEAFLLMMKQVPNCQLFGLPSQGSSGNPKPHELENGVTVYLPSWKAMLPDGTCFEGIGIQPDVRVDTKASDFMDGDPVLEAALKWLTQ